MQQQVYIRLQSEMFCFWGSTPNPGGLSLCAGRQYKEKTVHAFDTLPPRSAGAQVAPQRCPILRADENSVTQIGEIINTTIKIVLDMGYTSEFRVNCPHKNGHVESSARDDVPRKRTKVKRRHPTKRTVDKMGRIW